MVTTSQIQKLLTTESDHFEQLNMLEEARIFKKYADQLEHNTVKVTSQGDHPAQKKRWGALPKMYPAVGFAGVFLALGLLAFLALATRDNLTPKFVDNPAAVTTVQTSRDEATVVIGVQASDDDFDNLQSDAKRLYENMEYEDAISKYEKAIEVGTRLDTVRPKRIAELYGMLGHSYKELGSNQFNKEAGLENIEISLNFYTKSIEISKKLVIIDTFMYKNRAVANALLGNHDEAVDDYTISLDHRPDAVVFAARAHSYHHLDLCEFAIDDFKSALSIDTENISLMKGLGNTYNQCHEYDLAIEQFTNVIDLNPENLSEIYEYRADAYIKKKMCTKAAEDYQRVLSIGFSDTDRRNKVTKKMATYMPCK